MAGGSLLALLDDIATVLDDVAVMSKVAAKKTASVLGDDLALNAQQLTGVGAERELPIVWAVAKGSLRNKLILVPVALLLSYLAPWLIMPLLMLGGLYLCYEGAEKVIEKVFPTHVDKSSAVLNTPCEISVETAQQHEKEKIKGAIRTDFILSAEIIVIALSTVKGAALTSQIIVVSVIAFIMTIGVYGFVAGIVKIDDAGFYLQRHFKHKAWLFSFGQSLISFAPKLMKALTVVGTFAMFLVGGGIIVHNVAAIHHIIEPIIMTLGQRNWLDSLMPILLNGLVGLLAGLCVLLAHLGFHWCQEMVSKK